MLRKIWAGEDLNLRSPKTPGFKCPQVTLRLGLSHHLGLFCFRWWALSLCTFPALIYPVNKCWAWLRITPTYRQGFPEFTHFSTPTFRRGAAFYTVWCDWPLRHLPILKYQKSKLPYKAGDPNRTGDPLITSEELYQLSYASGIYFSSKSNLDSYLEAITTYFFCLFLVGSNRNLHVLLFLIPLSGMKYTLLSLGEYTAIISISFGE